MVIIKRLFIVFALAVLIVPIYSCTDTGVKEQTAVFKTVPEVQEIKPRKHVKIKLKRNAKGNYSWDISGDDIDEILKNDDVLKKSLKQ
ncbi:MAG TPA: hypothetical protein ENH40_04875 [Nitrospirae bacterium]|nr:hypothetical protein [Nitrospirota bacterium]